MAVLVAIAIPIFTSQLEKSRDATSVSNMRSAYAQAQTALLTYTDAVDGVDQDGVTVTKTGTTGYTAAVTDVAIKSKKADSWSGQATELPWWGTSATPADTGADATGTLTFTCDTDMKITSVAFAAN